MSARPKSPTTRELTPEETHKFRRLDQPTAVTFTVADGPPADAVTPRQHLELLLGPSRQATADADPAS